MWVDSWKRKGKPLAKLFALFLFSLVSVFLSTHRTNAAKDGLLPSEEKSQRTFGRMRSEGSRYL
jgi:hypothetical protein